MVVVVVVVVVVRVGTATINLLAGLTFLSPTFCALFLAAESKLWEQYDAVTGEELFQPKITENRGTGRNKEAGRVRGRGGSNETVPVHVRLAQKQQEYTDKRKKKEQRKIQQISNMSNKTVTPTMSSNSKHLVQQMEQRGDITPTR